MNLRRFLPHIALVIGAVLFSAGLQTLAFTPPSSAPPTGDAYAPLTTSDVGQTKAAGLHLKGANSIVADGNFVYNTGDGIPWWLTGYISGIGGNGPAIMLQKNVNSGGYQNRRGSLGWMDNGGTGAEVLTWVNGGNVGIGTTNPTGLLDVLVSGGVGAGFSHPILRLADTSMSGRAWDIYGSDGGAIPTQSFRISDTNTTNSTENWRFVIDNTGNVGIGTTNPSVKLHIQDGNTGFLFKDSGSTSGYTTTFSEDNTGLKIGHNSGSRDIQFQTNSNTKMTIHADGNVGIGTTNPGERLEVNGNVKASAFLYSSDINLKQNIQNIPNALQKIQQLNGVYFQWKESSKDGVGVIAQDIEKVFPELVATDPNTGLKSVSYGNLVAPLIEAIKEQQKQIDELKAEIEVLKGK